MAIPAVVLLFVFSYIPMYGVLIAFSELQGKLGILGSPWVGFSISWISSNRRIFPCF